MDQPETDRLLALYACDILDTGAEEVFDRLTALAADLFDTPMALISLIDSDRQWFKSRHGLAATETPRDWAFCDHAIRLGPRGLMVVEDARLDARFAANPLVTGAPHVRFYAGATLTTSGGANIGTLCVVDDLPRATPAPENLARLRHLADMAMAQIEQRQLGRLCENRRRQLEMAESLSGVGGWRIGLDEQRVEWSDDIYRIHGVTRASFEPNTSNSLDFYLPEDRPVAAAAFEQAFRDGQPFRYQLRIARPDGHIREIACKAECERDGQGRMHGLIGVVQDVTESRRALRRAMASERRYRMLADNMADTVTRIGLDGTSDYVSPAVSALLGYAPREMAGQPAQAFVHPKDRARVTAAFAELAAGRPGRVVEHRALRKDGSSVWVETSLRLVRDEQDQPAEMVAVIRDIGQRKALEEAMAQARDEAQTQAARALFAEKLAGLGHWRMDARTQQIVWSPHMYTIYGLAPSAPLELDALLAMTHPDDQAAVNARFVDQMSRGFNTEGTVNRIVRADGEVRTIEGRSQIERDAFGRIAAVVGTVIDVTERQRAETRLVDSEARYRHLADTASDIIAECGLDGTITYLSPAVTGITGFAPEDLVGRNALSFMHPRDAPLMRAMCRSVLRSDGRVRPRRVQYRARHRLGHEIWLESMPVYHRDPTTGRFAGLTDVIRDITAHKALEGKLREARAEAEAAVAVKTEFLANMSHELRTPLTAVLGFSRLVAEQPDLAPATRGYVERLTTAGKALLATVNDILDFSKLEAGQVEIRPAPASPAAILADTLALFESAADDKALTLAAEGLEGLPPYLTLDADRLRQILINLIGNAVKFTETGGVRLVADWDAARQRLDCRVIDTGGGIPAERLSRLFQRFSQVDGSSTRRHGGTGLGLAICKGLAEAMGGEIGVTSSPGAGSEFRISLPAVPGPAIRRQTLDQASGQAPAILPAGLRILVVDDNRANRDLVRAILSGFEVEVTEAADGLEAVECAQAAPFDLILMDRRMPGLDGEAAARRIRAEPGPNADIPILGFSADPTMGPDSPFDAMAGKPIEAAVLLAGLAALVSPDPEAHAHGIA